MDNPWIPKTAPQTDATGKITKDGRPSRKQMVFLAYQGKEALYGGAAGGGKLLYNGTIIPTPLGFVPLSDLHPGDLVIGRDGKSYRILAESEVVVVPAYRLTFDDGSELVAHDDHKWLTFDVRELTALSKRDPDYRAKRRAKRFSRAGANKSESFRRSITARNKAIPPKTMPPPTGSVRTTSEIVKTLRTKRGRANHAIPVAAPIELTPKKLAVDPYVLGVWLGDGTSLAGHVTTADSEIVATMIAAGFAVSGSNKKPKNKATTYYFDGLRAALKSLGVLGNKHVPQDYLWSSREQRLALLQGLLDTDGTVAQGGQAEFCNTRRDLAEAVAHLARSLGHKASVREGIAKLDGREICSKWTVKFQAHCQVFRLPRKASRIKIATRRTTKFRYIVSAKRVKPVAMKCLHVDSPDHLYLAGEHFIPTHNSDALLMAALQYVHEPGYAALILRRTRPMLLQADGLVPRSKAWFAGKGACYNETKMLWTFPSGATLQFGYLDQDKHLDNYQGGAWQFIGYDEVSQFPEARYRYLFSRLRKLEGSRVPLRMRAASNPGGPGHDWVKRRFVVGENLKFFVPAKLADNPGLDAEAYIRAMTQLDPIRRAQLLAGDWDAYEGGRFKERWFRYFRAEQSPNGAWRYILGDGPNDYANVSECWNCVICDPACTEKDVDEGGDADPTAIGAFAITPNYNILILHIVRKWLDIDDIPKVIGQVANDYSANWIGIEDNGFAVGITRACQRMGLTVKSLSPEGKGKLVRATPAIIRCEAGQIYLPEKGTLAWVGQDKWCEEFVSELIQFTGDEKLDAHDDQCVAAGTLISTDCGEVPIELLRPGDMILTRKGYRRLLAMRMTDSNADLWQLRAADRRTLVATANHPIFAEASFLRMDMLTCGDRLVVCNARQSRLTACVTTAIPTQSKRATGATSRRISNGKSGRAICTRTFGFSTTDLSPLGTKSTTRTATLSTTTSATSNVSPWANILENTVTRSERPSRSNTCKESGPKPLLGIARKRVGNGIGKWLKEPGPSEKRLSGPARSAASSILVCSVPAKTFVFAPIIARQKLAENLASTMRNESAPSAASPSASTNTIGLNLADVPVQHVYALGKKGPVFNLLVADAHEYFANGILCHNCDVLAYCVQAVNDFGSGQTIVVQPDTSDDADDDKWWRENDWQEADYGGLTGWQR